jgi:hypothetical protein
MEGNNNDYFYDYVRLDILKNDENTGKQYQTPLILRLTDNINSVYISRKNGKYSTIMINDDDYEYEFDVANEKVEETFDKIYEVLRNLSSESETDDSHNDID